MMSRPLACILLLATSAIEAQTVSRKPAQPPSRRPDQFYTNGESVNAWTPNESQKAQTTLWFAKNPPDSITYRQMLAINYDSQPDKVFYVDPATRLFIGRYDLATDKFSLLPQDARKKQLTDIDDAKFPAAAEPPTIASMFEPLLEKQPGNDNRLLPPPPTMKFPRLQDSAWDTNYMAYNRERIKSLLQFADDKGTYRLTDKAGTGRLTNVRYEPQPDGHLIQGDWDLGNSQGWFRFTIPADNLNVLWGEFGFEPGKTVGAWDGIRRSRPVPPDDQASRRRGQGR